MVVRLSPHLHVGAEGNVVFAAPHVIDLVVRAHEGTDASLNGTLVDGQVLEGKNMRSGEREVSKPEQMIETGDAVR